MKLLAFLLTLIISATVLAQDSRPNGPTRPSKTDYFISAVAMVMVARDAPTSSFALSLIPKKPLPPGATLLIEFENPIDANSPFVVTAALNEKGELHAQSPKFEGIKNKRAYLARTKITGPDKQLISEHSQWIWFEMPDVLRKAYATKVVD